MSHSMRDVEPVCAPADSDRQGVAGDVDVSDVDRRALLTQAACVAGAWIAGGASAVQAAPAPAVQSHARALLVDALREPLRASRLPLGEPFVFTYPFHATPAFLMALTSPVGRTSLQTEARQAYEAPSGVGPTSSIVAFSAICSHKLMYPTRQISFIGLRKGQGDEPAHVIHCCGDQSRYDALHGARVIGGPAPQPLAAIALEWDPRTDHLHAVGTLGGEMYATFFERYAFKLELEHGTKARQSVGPMAVTLPAAAYSRQWQTCRA
jgi:Rieske Fe-S protein